jgi:hypothetical protein
MVTFPYDSWETNIKIEVRISWVMEVTWDRVSTELVRKCAFFNGNGNENHELCVGSLYIRESYHQLGWMIKFVRARISYIILRDFWCDIILNVHAPTEDKSGYICEGQLQ